MSRAARIAMTFLCASSQFTAIAKITHQRCGLKDRVISSLSASVQLFGSPSKASIGVVPPSRFAIVNDRMPWTSDKWAILLSAIALLSFAIATPRIQFPVNSQVPPVARASQPYTFTFAQSTFTSVVGHINYTLSDEPAWLQLDNGTRTFSGTPGSNDVGSVTFQLIANDGQGVTLLTVTLVVVQDGLVEVGRPIYSQLAGFSVPSSPSSIMFYPLQSFAFNFSPDTFLQTSPSTTYYAISGDNTPLPSWLEFDASNLGFSGTTPPLVSPTALPQTYGVKLIASDVLGFSEASAAFQMVVGYHILSFFLTELNINSASGKEVATPSLRGALRLDGKSVRDKDIASVISNAPRWLVLDQQNISLSGIPPADAADLSVTISVVDVLSDFASATINFSFTLSTRRLFLGAVPAANATIGQEFNYTISRDLLATDNVTVMADLGSASVWMAFDPSTLSFNGKVPQALAPGPVGIALYATLGNETDEETLRIDILRASTTTTLPLAAPSLASAKSLSSIAPSASTSPTTASRPLLSRGTQLKIILATVLSTVAFILLVMLFICCRRRKQKLPTGPSPRAPDPIPASPASEQVEPGTDAEITKPIHSEAVQRSATPDEAPRIELSWAADSLRTSKARLSKSRSARDESFMNLGFNGSLHENSNEAPQHFVRRSQDVTPFVSIRRSNKSQRRTLHYPDQTKTEPRVAPKRASRALSGVLTLTPELSNRLNGAGHGSGGIELNRCSDIRSSWQDTQSSFPSIDSRATALDIVQAFPQPPAEPMGGMSTMSPQRGGKASLRIVATSSSQTDSNTGERQRWQIKEARDPLERGARFSHAWSTRPHSEGRPTEADGSTLSLYDQLTPTNNVPQAWPHDMALRGSVQPDLTDARRSPGRPSIRAPSKLIRCRSTASSGQFDSALSTSSSQWEDEVLSTEVNFQGERAQHAAESGWTDIKAHSRRSAIAATDLGELSPAIGLDGKPASRKLRLGDVPGQRPVSVGQGIGLQSAQLSHQGSLAFI